MSRRPKIEKPPETALVADPATGKPIARLDSLDAWRRFDFSAVNRLQQVVGYLQARTQEAIEGGLPPKRAKGAAVRATAKEFQLSERRVQQAEKELRETIDAMMKWSAESGHASRINELIGMHEALKRAAELLKLPAPGPLSERALAPDSPERLAAIFANSLTVDHGARIAAEARAEAAERELARYRTREAAEHAAPGFKLGGTVSTKH